MDLPDSKHPKASKRQIEKHPMKTKLCIAAVVLLSAVWVHAEDASPATPDELKTVATIDVAGPDKAAALAKNEGKIVRLRFSHREGEPKKEGENTVVPIAFFYSKGTMVSGQMALVVPPAGAAWAAKIAPTYKRGSSEFVYARVVSAKGEKAFALGKEIKNGAKGQELAW